MSLFSRTFAELFSYSARQRFILHPVLHHSSSFYSTATTSKGSQKNTQRKAKSRDSPSPPPPPPPSLSLFAASADQKNVVSQKDKCVYGDGYEWPRPSEIPWQAKVANSVNLIGYLQIPVQFEASQDGKYWAGTVITQHKASHSSLWIQVIFEGNLAHIAACHLKENDYVHIAGQLSADPPPFTKYQQGQANVQVMASSINFVERPSQIKKTCAPLKQEELNFTNAASVKDDISITLSWKDLLARPHEWWDIRLEKGDSMGAAYERKDNGELLFIDESTPDWIQRNLDALTFDLKSIEQSKETANLKKDGSSALYWRNLLQSPKEWWDYRKHKLSGTVKPKYPDFKRKDHSHSLWVVSAPRWVLPGLDGLEFDDPIDKTKQVKELRGDEEFWKDLVDNPDKWWDNRLGKVNVKSPDFKHKNSGKGLWLERSPDWVLSKLPPAKPAIHKRDTLLS